MQFNRNVKQMCKECGGVAKISPPNKTFPVLEIVVATILVNLVANLVYTVFFLMK